MFLVFDEFLAGQKRLLEPKQEPLFQPNKVLGAILFMAVQAGKNWFSLRPVP